MSRADGSHGGVVDNDVGRTVAIEAARSIGGAFGIGDEQMNIFDIEGCAGGDAERAMEMKREVAKNDLAANGEFAIGPELAGACYDRSIVQRGQGGLRKRTRTCTCKGNDRRRGGSHEQMLRAIAARALS
jgi:hypothetical protein